MNHSSNSQVILIFKGNTSSSSLFRKSKTTIMTSLIKTKEGKGIIKTILNTLINILIIKCMQIVIVITVVTIQTNITLTFSKRNQLKWWVEKRIDSQYKNDTFIS